MDNKEIQHALDYHEATKHSEVSLMTSRHYLDWENRPMPFKVYLEQPNFALTDDFPKPDLDSITAIRNSKQSMDSTAIPNEKSLTINDLSEILFFSAGITRVMKYSYGTYYMRAASATGALYPIELYVVCGDIHPDLKAGIYHFGPADFSLTQIRSGDYRYSLASSALADREHDTILTSPLSIIFSSLAWRNAWKYQARSYRHWFWDGGVIAANLIATTASMKLPTKVIMGYVDDLVNRLLCLEDRKEASIAIASIGIGSSAKSNSKNIDSPQKEIVELPIPRILPLSQRGEVDYPDIWTLHQASKLIEREQVEKWTGIKKNGILEEQQGPPANNGGSISKQQQQQKQRQQQPNLDTDASSESTLDRKYMPEEMRVSARPTIGEVILQRGSTRRFDKHSSVPLSTLYTIIDSSTRGVPMDVFANKEDTSTLIDTYFIANNVDGLDPGAYFFNRKLNTFDLLKKNTSRQISGYLCLGQSLFSDASAVIFLMTDLHKTLDEYGNRGYRVAQLEAGIIAGNIYLSSYAHSIGASGTTFFDDAVTEFFSPHSANKSTMVAVGIGIPGYKARPGTVLPVRLTKEQLTGLHS
jgi:SagB-type dehydrogenase family enzyme